jgi:ABC-type sugar transport system substrate-binding protein
MNTINRSFAWTCAIAATILAALALAACGSSNDDKSATVSTTSGSSSSSTASAVAGKAAAEKLVQEASAPVTFEPPGPPIDVKPLAGKTIWFVAADFSIPFVQQVAKGAKEAAAAAGVKFKVLDGKGQTNLISNAVDQAVAGGAAAIIDNATNFKFIKGAVDRARKAGIPVIGEANIDANDPIEEGAAGEVTIDYRKSGELLAAYAVAKSDSPPHGLFLNMPSIQTFTALKKGVDDGFAKFCGSECSLKSVDI